MNILTNTQFAASPALYVKNGNMNAEPLTEADKQEVLEFLSTRPVDTVILAGLIRDHGIVSKEHRGTFFGCRDANGVLAGVAMIGRNLLFEAHTDEAIAALAIQARECPDVRMIFAEEEKLRSFWRWYKPDAVMPEPTRHQMIRSCNLLAEIETVEDIRIATLDDLDPIVSAHAEMVLAETGVDPLVADPDGFRMRCAGRVEKGRVWVWFKNGELIFKTDIVTETADAAYSEGLWVNPKERGKGYATRCLTSLCRRISAASMRLCGFLDAKHTLSNSIYGKAGFMAVAEYAKVYI